MGLVPIWKRKKNKTKKLVLNKNKLNGKWKINYVSNDYNKLNGN